ncbi:MAG: TlpA family protein disulfide reductase [Desulfobacterales bacterium]|nr:TlpA family protein disulfide reductase [Pseudomonadota bacterium]MBU4354522.1 TlpA family protein disulfide reductase [Pseudomonadota bacterium]MCG2772612.1 TlpA family protein disulfide reductase [Desulfobacterales bacterium]
MTHKSYRLSWTMARMLIVTVCVLALALPSWGAGKPAPNFSLKDVLQGKEYSLSQFKGKVVVINFFTFFCGPCRDEMPDLNKINTELKGKGLQTLGIALSSNPTQIRFLVKQLGLEYPVLIGNDKVSDAYGSIAVVPTTVIIDKEGNVAQRIEGTRKKEVFMKLIQPLL